MSSMLPTPYSIDLYLSVQHFPCSQKRGAFNSITRRVPQNLRPLVYLVRGGLAFQCS